MPDCTMSGRLTDPVNVMETRTAKGGLIYGLVLGLSSRTVVTARERAITGGSTCAHPANEDVFKSGSGGGTNFR